MSKNKTMFEDAKSLLEIGIRVKDYNGDVAQIIFTSADLILKKLEESAASPQEQPVDKTPTSMSNCDGQCTTCLTPCHTERTSSQLQPSISSQTQLQIETEVDEYTSIIRKELGLG